MQTAISQSALSCSVLVLNKYYMPLRIIGARRAFTMLCKQMAEVVHCKSGQFYNYDFNSWQDISRLKQSFEPEVQDWISTVNFDIAVPRIVRLLFYAHLPRTTVRFNRRNIFARDANKCQYCGKKFPAGELSLDHVVPRSMGGASSWENLVCACTKCNSRKGGRIPEEANMKLIKTPQKPKRSPTVHLHLSRKKYHSWKQFLDIAYWSVELT